MNDYFEINIVYNSGEKTKINKIKYGERYQYMDKRILVDVGDSFPIPVSIKLLTDEIKVQSIEYYFTTDLKNFTSVIVPDSGRWFPNAMKMVTFWKSYRNLKSSINDIKMPIYIFNGQDKYMDMAIGIIGDIWETEFNLIEPVSNRALNVHTGKLKLQIKKGTYNYPLYERITQDVIYKEYIYYSNTKRAPKQPWMITLREFTIYQRNLFKLKDIFVRKSLYPIWCTWVDWDSNDLNEEMILENVKLGVEVGIKNYIIDDGWFGPGLDNDYSIPLNIGNWTPDPQKIGDMKSLVSKIKGMGANAIIWCAPHALAKQSFNYNKYRKYIINDGKQDVICPPQFYSLCFMCPEARKIMADICESFVVDWDFDGAKYDLFNWVPDIKCNNPHHRHDVDSMIEGLSKTLELIDNRTRTRKKDYIVELKQNYGTPFFSRWGTMMRAGDAPFDPEMNFLRTLHIQSYTPFALNDYQTFTNKDTPKDIAVSILKMIAVGIPSYSVNLKKLNKDQLFIISKLNNWYISHLDVFSKNREQLDAEGNIIKIYFNTCDYLFKLSNTKPIKIERNTNIYNASYEEHICFYNKTKNTIYCTTEDCFGNTICRTKTNSILVTLSVPIGGCIKARIHDKKS